MHPDFEKNGYLVARDFLNKTTISLAQTYFDFKYRIINFSEENRNNAFKSVAEADINSKGDIGTSFNFYSDHLLESIHLNYGEKVSNLLQINLSPTYTFARIYEKNYPLLPHIDRPACEISATCPIMISDDRPSTIYISNYTADVINDPGRVTFDEIERRGDYSEVNLFPGDVMFYKGCERYHWRKPLQSDSLVQFFMHFVETDGIYKEWYFDKRPYSGFPGRLEQSN